MASILLRMDEGQREAIKAASKRAGLPVSAWALGVLIQSASHPIPSMVVPLSKLDAARVALEAGERKAAPLGRPVSFDAPAVRCSRHKVLGCHRCAP